MKNIILLLTALLMSCHVMAQETIVTGTITDVSDGSPLIGANILVKGTGVGSIADVKGEYSVKVPVGKHILVFSCIGYKEQEITIKAGQKVLNVMMTEDSELLDEVVVVGYGTMKKSDLTGSVTSIKSEELMKTNPVSINQSLQGRIAGVQVNQNDGAPGAGISIQIRGANSFSTSTEPLYVVDGIPFTTGGTPGAGRDEDGMLQSANPLSSINPADIESVEVLKDASATAIYGSRGANGVVLITTKRGVKGKENISFSANFGISKVVKKMDMLDGYTYAKYRNEATEMFNEYDGAREALPYPGKELLNTSTGEYEYAPGPDDYRNGTCAWTNWQDQVFETALSQEYNLSVNGASDKGYYAISGNILDQEGTIRNSGYKRYSFRANIARKIHKWIEIGTNMSFTNSLNKLAKTVLVFSRTKHNADRIVRVLGKAGIGSQAIHGNKSQNARQSALENFKSGKIRVMIATDIAARGIDINELPLVINYDLPDVPETYVHRIGRTGRAGNSGTALSFCSQEERKLVNDIQKLTGKKLSRAELAI